MWTGRWEVDVDRPVGFGVTAAVVARGDADGDAQGCGVDECLVQGGSGLGGPGVLALAPADAERCWGRSGVHCGGDGVEEAAVGVGGEVDDDRRLGGQGAGDLDVEQHLTVGALRVLAGDVGRAVDADGADRRGSDAQAGEVGVEVGLGVAATQLDDGQRLPGAVGTDRKL